MASTSVATRVRSESLPTVGELLKIYVIDSRRLRCAGLVRLLEEWAAANGLAVVAISRPEELNAASNCCMVVISIGGASVLELEPQLWIKMARTILADTPLVILSDREEPGEICAAFKEGARGFIATNLDPAIALEALNFLRHGGSFFPISVLEEPRSPAGEARPAHPQNEEARAKRAVVRVSARLASWRGQATDPAPVKLSTGEAVGFVLTPRQRDVLERLREGKPNKLIARDLNMTEATVKVHVRQIMHKLGAKNRTQAVLCAARLSAEGA